MRLDEFKNQALMDFGRAENQAAMESALTEVRDHLGAEYELLIGGEAVRSGEKFNSLNPSRSTEVVGVFQKASPEMAERAIGAADQAFQNWSQTKAEERVETLLRVSQIMQRRRLELAAWMVVEVGKSWVEADADVAETIDFCEYYCRSMLRLSDPPTLTQVPSEESELGYIPLGVGVIIPPWNFPLAILAGMTLAAVVSGNTVVVKPSSDSPTIAAQLIEIFKEACLPPGVVNFVTGSGGEIGDTLVRHPRTRFIAFTGSREVGLHINEAAAKPQPGQIWIKRVIAEMGGKDAIIVDEETDLETAAEGVVASAFGFQGQKCSACSRAIVVEPIYDQFLEILEEKTNELIHAGSVENGDVNFGPVINQTAHQSILRYIEVGKQEGRLLVGGEPDSTEGFFIQPTILSDIAPNAVIAQEEIFGPVLAVIKAADYAQAIDIANDSQYGLTGAVYTDNERKIEQARRRFHVGNLYVNRKCTGALVGAHPFGGFNMSGTDSKAGGPDYLLLFTQAKAISRKIG